MKRLGFVVLLACLAPAAHAQVEFMPWGNAKGLRVDGQLMAFETSIRLVDPDWEGYTTTEKYNWEGQPTYVRNGRVQTASHALLERPLAFTVTATDVGDGEAKLDVQLRADDDIPAAGAYYCLEIPGVEFQSGTVELLGATGVPSKHVIAPAPPAGRLEYFRATVRGLRVRNRHRVIELQLDQPSEVFLRQDFIAQPHHLNDPKPRQRIVPSDPRQPIADLQAYVTLAPGDVKKGMTLSRTFTLMASGEIDRAPIELRLDASRPGRPFDGVSGNFRLQFPDRDPAVIQYCLDNLRVTWGRISLAWMDWQPEETTDPVARARAGQLPKDMYDQMEIARTLARRGIPVIVSVWWPPKWAVSPGPRLPRGLQLDEKKLDQVAESIAQYLVYLKEAYGVEARLFSFNEPDVGVEVFQTPWEHALHTKVLGTRFAAKGLGTRILVGDTGHGTALANRIVGTVVADPEARGFIGAIAFHTYHGLTESDLAAWSASAEALALPLLATEAGLDSAAHRYEQVFLEPWFQLKEIATYLRICNTVQPATIMEWQFTSDYSVLTGGGNYGDGGPLRPTMRFWNLKQLGSTPAGAFALPVASSRPNVDVAAFGDVANGTYAVHLVNSGAERKVVLSGLPDGIEAMRGFVTDMKRGMQETKPVAVQKGVARFVIDPGSYLTLLGTKK